MNGKRIAFFHPYFNDGGIEKGMVILAGKFSQRGIRTDIVSFRAKPVFLGSLPPGCRFIDLGSKRAASCIVPLARYLRSARPDCLISAQSYANLAAIAANLLAGRRARLVVTERVAISMERGRFAGRMGFGSWKNRLILFLMKALYPISDVVAANSVDGARDLQAYFPAGKVRVKVLHNPTFDKAFVARADEALDHPWFAPKTKPVLISVGRLNPQKDYPTLLKAFARVRSALPCRLMILGEGKDRVRLEAQAAELKLGEDVAFPGFCDNPYKFVGRADVFVLSSLFEGLPNALIEAVAVGTPSISTDCLTGPREILLDGKGGALTPVGDDALLAEAVLRCLRDPGRAKAMAEVARQGLSRFESESVADEYLKTCLQA